MADNTTNQGGNLLVWSINGILKTVVRNVASPFAIIETYRMKKAVDVDFDLSPAFQLKFDDDADFDPVPSGDVGTFAVRIPLTSDIVSVTVGKDITSNDDKNTLTYWFHELFNRRFPPIEFDDEAVDNQPSPNQKKVNFRFKGYLTSMRKVRTETEGVFDLELSGIMRPDTVAEIAVDKVAEILKTTVPP